MIIRKRNAPFIWIKAFSLLSGYLLTHGQKPGTLASTLIPAIKKVDEMVSQVKIRLLITEKSKHISEPVIKTL